MNRRLIERYETSKNPGAFVMHALARNERRREAVQEERKVATVTAGLNNQQQLAYDVVVTALTNFYERPFNAKRTLPATAITNLAALGHIISEEDLEDRLAGAFKQPGEHIKRNALLERLGNYITTHYQTLQREALEKIKD
ncbi:MAG: hypothetical protein Q7R96_01850 [Nanoarchaeota archaeon]|nr:hypothetical protein [Nanoarchaeota archaeon]